MRATAEGESRATPGVVTEADRLTLGPYWYRGRSSYAVRSALLEAP